MDQFIKAFDGSKPFNRKYHSYSQLSSYQACGRKFYYSYCETRPRKPAVALLIGSNVDLALSAYFMGKPWEEIFWNGIAEASDEDLDEEQLKELLDDAPKMVTAIKQYISEIGHKITPYSLQEEVYIKLPGLERPIIGFIDLVYFLDGELILTDWKTANKTMKNPYQNHKQQLSLYAIYLMKKYELKKIPKIQLHFFIKTKTPKINILDVDISETIQRVSSEFIDLQRNIERGYFPRNFGSNLCSKKYCDHFQSCHMEAIEDSEDLENLLNNVSIKE